MKVIIVGGGIGGLTTALMLHARGIDCEIYEQSDAIRELGEQGAGRNERQLQAERREANRPYA